MGGLWAILLVIGTMAPALAVAATCLLVALLAKRLRERSPASRPPWQWVVGHLALITVVEGASSVVVGFAAPGLVVLVPSGLAALSMLVVPSYLYRGVRAASPYPPVETTSDAAVAVDGAGAPTRPARWDLALLFALTGVFVPWMVGLGVKIYLDWRGRPTLPVSDFLDPRALPVLLFQTLVLWAFPFLILGAAVVVAWRPGFGRHQRGGESLLPVWLAYAGGVLAEIPLFIGIFWEFDAIMLIVPLGLYLLPPMVVGYLIGSWVVARRLREPS